MNRFRPPNTFEKRFAFLENKSKNMAGFFKWVVLAGLVVNVAVIVLLNFGIVRAPVHKTSSLSTPAPTPVHFLEHPENP